MTKKAGADKRPHGFSFFGGKTLNKMGAAWFVSYAYHEHVDQSHTNWKKVGSKNRISHYVNSFSYHRYWLDKIATMDKLDLNKIDLSASEVKEMAKAVMLKEW